MKLLSSLLHQIFTVFSDEEEQMCRDLVMAISSPRSESTGVNFNEDLFKSVLSQLRLVSKNK